MNKAVFYPFAAFLTLTPFAVAQSAQTQSSQTQPGQSQPGNPPGRNPAFAATFDLVREVNGLNELSRDPKTTINKTQAGKLLPILKEIQSAKTLPAASATKTLGQIEGVLNDAQLGALDALALKRQQQGGRGGQRSAGQGQNGQSQGGQNTQGGTRGTGYIRTPGMNPFLQGRSSDGLKALIKSLTQTAKGVVLP